MKHLRFPLFSAFKSIIAEVASRKRKPRDPSPATMSILPLCTQALMKICEVRRSTIPPAPESIRANSRLSKNRSNRTREWGQCASPLLVLQLSPMSWFWFRFFFFLFFLCYIITIIILSYFCQRKTTRNPEIQKRHFMKHLSNHPSLVHPESPLRPWDSLRRTASIQLLEPATSWHRDVNQVLCVLKKMQKAQQQSNSIHTIGSNKKPSWETKNIYQSALLSWWFFKIQWVRFHHPPCLLPRSSSS